MHEAVVLNVVMLVVSYARSFVLRVMFARERPPRRCPCGKACRLEAP